jgi:hypothetical protein
LAALVKAATSSVVIGKTPLMDTTGTEQWEYKAFRPPRDETKKEAGDPSEQ